MTNSKEMFDNKKMIDDGQFYPTKTLNNKISSL
jgi:hypothetical protein